MKLFMFFYMAHRHYDDLVELRNGFVSGKRRAWYAFMAGVARAGIYIFS